MNIERDIGKVEYVDVAKINRAMLCPACRRRSIKISNGIEIGNIFQLGTKYTKSMGMTYLDENNESQHPIMGCYGIGVGRLIASICEESHDKFGPIWPITIAPWQVELCNLRNDEEVVANASVKLYEDLKNAGVEVLYDDRDIRPGAMFADADLFGCPIRVVVSPKTCEKGVVEISTRDKSVSTEVEFDKAVDAIKDLIKQLMAQYEI
jgi:prolyl-tRNA synthetase